MRRALLLLFFGAIALSGFSGRANAQNRLDGPLDLPAYDISSIRLNTQGTGSWNIHTGNGTFEAREVSIKTLLANAYDIRENLIYGLSVRMESLRFDITAKLLDPSIDPTDKQLSAMMQQILLQRFHLKVHLEQKTLPVYNLVIARQGFKLKPPPAQDHPTGNMRMNNTNDYSELTAKGVTMPDLAAGLSQQLRQTVIDKTGLTGSYDFQLRWRVDTPDSSAALLPSLPTVLEEELGVKLDASKGLVATLVVDHVEMPTANRVLKRLPETKSFHKKPKKPGTKPVRRVSITPE